jgi:hypothetical protein
MTGRGRSVINGNVPGISLKSHKLLWGRAAGRCSICKIILVEDGVGVLGEIAHIIAESTNGPRGCDTFSAELLNDYENLILLCPNHHTEIDKVHPDAYTVARLHQIKEEHERWVEESLTTSDLDQWVAAQISQIMLEAGWCLTGVEEDAEARGYNWHWRPPQPAYRDASMTVWALCGILFWVGESGFTVDSLAELRHHAVEIVRAA